MNQFNHSGTFNKSPSALTKPSSPTYQGYAHFSKFNIPELSKSSTFIKPPHMQDPSYVSAHAAKPYIDNKFIALNDLEDGIKLSVLADVERDQCLEQFKESLKRSRDQTNEVSENKRKADHQAFDKYVQRTSKEKSELEVNYGLKCLEFLKLQKEYDALKEKYDDAKVTINSNKFENNRLTALVLVCLKQSWILLLKTIFSIIHTRKIRSLI